ncbi:hypothetical protein BKK81_12795 [Cupriavidus sp. USMAHM13]|uniref:Uncharacterized protein n=1 Tax=Cupriavidus malaysiensis TaxID=367825 RepID=A0ABM6F570_9BURK|nr:MULTISPECIES: hypothetical protein [Cupriavidus]AOZ00015.1 hypothetical protein BKK81_12795 [Cupriavidus sp. USMAHM13]AOZ06628.1 hypothetical protein BKK80_13010 [Cupriavidus malaysiensis]
MSGTDAHPAAQGNPANTAALASMRAALDAHVAGRLAAGGLVQGWRDAAVGLSLPPVFGQAMEELLRRLEMSAVFAQDSCSFSSNAVTDQLKRWLDKAAQQ